MVGGIVATIALDGVFAADLLSAGPVTGEPIIRVDDVAQRFGARTIFRDVSFTVSTGEVFVILGGSGCGKSTLMKQLIGLLTPSAGRIEIFGRDDHRAAMARRRCATCSARWA